MRQTPSSASVRALLISVLGLKSMRVIFEPLAHHLDIGATGYCRPGDMIEIPTRAFEAKLMLSKGSAIKLVKPGRILFEIAGVTRPEAVEAFRLAGMKLPVSTVIVERSADLGQVVFGKKFLQKVALGVPTTDEAPAAAGAAPKEPELVKPAKPAKEDEA